jgi:sugar/nucleoside kinase (ribokinase family)
MSDAGGLPQISRSGRAKVARARGAQARDPQVFVIGNVNVDLIMGPLAPWPAPGTENILTQSELRVGGAAGNAALALQALGVPYRLVCNIGDDIFGHWLRRAFGKAGWGWPVAPVPTTVSVGVTHPNGERTFLTSRGHLDVMSFKNAIVRLPERAQRGDIALLLGAFLCPQLLEFYETLIKILVEGGFEIALDTGWPSEGWSEAIRHRVTAWLQACDHLLLNEMESCGLSRQPDVETAARWLGSKAKPGAAIVIKQGPGGATAWRNLERIHVAAPEVKVIDTIGAGDAFDAGYLAARLVGRDLAAAVAEGVAVASAAVSTSPRRYSGMAGFHALSRTSEREREGTRGEAVGRVRESPSEVAGENERAKPSPPHRYRDGSPSPASKRGRGK